VEPALPSTSSENVLTSPSCGIRRPYVVTFVRSARSGENAIGNSVQLFSESISSDPSVDKKWQSCGEVWQKR